MTSYPSKSILASFLVLPWNTKYDNVESFRCSSICEVQFDRRDSGETISVPEASAGTGTGVMPLSFGSATSKLKILN